MAPPLWDRADQFQLRLPLLNCGCCDWAVIQERGQRVCITFEQIVDRLYTNTSKASRRIAANRRYRFHIAGATQAERQF